MSALPMGQSAILSGGYSPWQAPLAALFSGISAAAQPGGFANFGQGAIQGTQNFQQGQQQQQMMQLRQMQIQQAEEEQRRANQEEAQRQAVIENLRRLGSTTGSSTTPVQPVGNYGATTGGIQTASAQPAMFGDNPQLAMIFQGLLDAGDVKGALSLATDYATQKPAVPEAPVVKDFYEGGQTVQKQWDGSQWVEVGRGARWQPQQPGADSSGVGLELFYTTDAQGKLHAWQPSRSGKPVEVTLPGDQSLAPGVQYLNAGTQFVPVDKRSGQPVGAPVPIDVAGQNAQQEVGTSTGKVISGLPDAEAKAQEASDLIARLKTHPGRSQATGLSSYVPALAGTQAKDFNVQLDQLKGTVFLQAYSQLKGGGAITEVEGQKAEQAIARLDTAQSEGEFVKALDELDGIIKAGISRMKQRAGSPVRTPEDSGGPTVVKELPEGFQ